MAGETATLVGRRLDSSGTWQRTNYTIRIRAGTNDLWLKHKTLDIAAVPINVPRDALRNIPTTDHFISQKRAEELQLHPGDRLYCLGYPLGMEGNAVGFPILRMGIIASYPILPVKDNPTFAFAFDVFGGNSGGPVYLYETSRKIGNKIDFGTTRFGIAGIVVSERTFQSYTETLTEKRQTTTSLAISDVIQAEFILELLEEIPPPS
jgi:hypothetical protein